MVRNKFSVLIYVIVGLAVLGLVTQLFTNTIGFFTNILVMIGIGLAVFAAIYFLFLKKQTSSSNMKKYKQAVKQSNLKYKKKEPISKMNMAKKQSQSIQMKKKSNKRAPHLRVIDGNKQKRKNRATF